MGQLYRAFASRSVDGTEMGQFVAVLIVKMDRRKTARARRMKQSKTAVRPKEF